MCECSKFWWFIASIIFTILLIIASIVIGVLLFVDVIETDKDIQLGVGITLFILPICGCIAIYLCGRLFMTIASISTGYQ